MINSLFIDILSAIITNTDVFILIAVWKLGPTQIVLEIETLLWTKAFLRSSQTLI